MSKFDDAYISKFQDDVVQVSTSSCETIYEVFGHKIRLYIITGGTPALSFSDYSFVERFPYIEKWKDSNFLKDELRYSFQDANNIQGPTFEVLPNGINDLIDFVNSYSPLHKLRQERFLNLPDMSLPFPVLLSHWHLASNKCFFSNRYYDKENGCYFYCVVDLSSNYIPSVLYISKERTCSLLVYGHDSVDVLWHELAKLLHKFHLTYWENLSESDYNLILEYLEKISTGIV